MSNTDQQRDTLSPVKRAILELREMRAKLDELEWEKTEPIAIIGMGCRFPGDANDPASTWRLLRDGVDAISEVPPDRWDIDAFYDPDPDKPGKMSTRWGGFVKDVDKFDADLFGISPREAVGMDPQQRLLLTVAWEALEHAGQAPHTLMGSPTGVFVGIASFDYTQMQMQFLDHTRIDAYWATGASHSIASGRLSYVLGLQGPSMSLDTACSSSLVAVHLACQSLRSRECNLALAGGVNLILVPELLINFSKAHMMAADGRCKTFDATADGFVRGEGAGVIVLKRLTDAVADGDNILALIRGSAMNQDGRSNGITAPNGPSQQAVIRKALQQAGVTPSEISYVECHGTGTALGDPIEVQSLGAVLAAGRSPDNPVIIGSIKTNIGHLETAAGVAGLIKVVLALQHQEIPPHLHFQEPNPHIPWEELGVTVPTSRTPWPARQGRRLAGVSSLGFSGTNAHVILEEAPVTHQQESARSVLERPLHLLNISARTETALQALAGRYERYFSDHPSASFTDVCFTANAGRGHFDWRLSMQARTAQEAQRKIATWRSGEESLGVFSGCTDSTNPPEVVFLFTGQGGQYVGMGRQLYDTQPTFRRALERCDALLRPHLERSLLAVLYPEPGQSSPLHDTNYTQPVTFALQYALAELWRAWGITPGLIMGHSVGEIVAATVAGMMSLEDGLMLVTERGRLMHSLSEKGMMASITAGEEAVAEALDPYKDAVAIAALNGPESTVISGERQAVQAMLQHLEGQGIKTKPLQISHAFHSPLVEPILDAFEAAAARARLREPTTALFSSMRLQMATGDRLLDAAYWRHNLRHTVRFAEAMHALRAKGYKVFVELGPTPILVAMGQKCYPEGEGVWLPALRYGRDDWEQMLESVSMLYVNGVKVDWAGFDRDYSRRRVSLPTYPFEPQTYWLDELRVWQHGYTPTNSSSWESVTEAALQQSRQVPIDMMLYTYPDKWHCLDKLTITCIAEALQSLGMFVNVGSTHSVNECMRQYNIVPMYRHLVQRWLKQLTLAGIVEEHGEYFTRRGSWPHTVAATVLRDTRDLFSDSPLLVDYLQRCGPLLVPILMGREGALETLFPGDTKITSDFLYHDGALSRYFTGIIRAVVACVVRELPSHRPLRCIEIGAGTGDTTAAILPALSTNRTVYDYTDVAEAFLTQAMERFKAYPFVRYGLLDIEQKPQGQHYGSHDFDVVVAANVLHATKDLAATLENVLSLLKPGGLLVLYETTHRPTWTDITIGLIEGGQHREDTWRQDHPFLTRDLWTQALQMHGFEHVAAFPEPGSPAEILLHHIIVAQAPHSDELRQSLTDHTGSTVHDEEASQRFVPADSAEDGHGARRQAFLCQLQEVAESQRRELLVEYVRKLVVNVLRRDANQLPGRRQRLMDLGIDSLMAVELRNLLAVGVGLQESLPATLIFDYPNIEAIAGLLEKRIFSAPEPIAHRNVDIVTGHNRQRLTEATIAELSDAEVEKMLAERLEKI